MRCEPTNQPDQANQPTERGVVRRDRFTNCDASFRLLLIALSLCTVLVYGVCTTLGHGVWGVLSKKKSDFEKKTKIENWQKKRRNAPSKNENDCFRWGVKIKNYKLDASSDSPSFVLSG